MSEHSPAILGGEESCYSESFHPVLKKIAEFTLSVVQELPEVGGQWEGKVVQEGGNQGTLEAGAL